MTVPAKFASIRQVSCVKQAPSQPPHREISSLLTFPCTTFSFLSHTKHQHVFCITLFGLLWGKFVFSKHVSYVVYRLTVTFLYFLLFLFLSPTTYIHQWISKDGYRGHSEQLASRLTDFPNHQSPD